MKRETQSRRDAQVERCVYKYTGRFSILSANVRFLRGVGTGFLIFIRYPCSRDASRYLGEEAAERKIDMRRNAPVIIDPAGRRRVSTFVLSRFDMRPRPRRNFSGTDYSRARVPIKKFRFSAPDRSRKFADETRGKRAVYSFVCVCL